MLLKVDEGDLSFPSPLQILSLIFAITCTLHLPTLCRCFGFPWWHRLYGFHCWKQWWHHRSCPARLLLLIHTVKVSPSKPQGQATYRTNPLSVCKTCSGSDHAQSQHASVIPQWSPVVSILPCAFLMCDTYFIQKMHSHLLLHSWPTVNFKIPNWPWLSKFLCKATVFTN